MRKMLALYFLVACLLLGGCQTPNNPGGSGYPNTTDAAAKPGFDAQNKYMLIHDYNFNETDEFYCGSMGNFAYYYDKASGLSGPLCADPACTHDSGACGAYIGQVASLDCYDGKRYWVAQNGRDFSLYRSDLAGTNQEKLKSLDWNKIILTYQPQWFAIHRNRLYALGRAQTVEGTEAGLRMTLLSMSLDESQEVAVLYDKTFGKGVWPTVRFVEDSIYFSMFSYSEGSPQSISITKFGIEDGSAETVYEEMGFTGNRGSIWVTDQGEVYLSGTESDRAYLWKLEDGKREEIACWVGENLFTPDVADGIAFTDSRKDGIRLIDVVDFSGKTIYSGKMFPKEIPGVAGDPNKYSYAVIGGDREKIILAIEGSPGSASEGTEYTLLLDLQNNLKPTVLWSSER